jgi:hypothetical protein
MVCLFVTAGAVTAMRLQFEDANWHFPYKKIIFTFLVVRITALYAMYINRI